MLRISTSRRRAFSASISAFSAAISAEDEPRSGEADGDVRDPVMGLQRALNGLPVTIESTLPMMSLPRSLSVWNVDFGGGGAAGFAGGAGGGVYSGKLLG